MDRRRSAIVAASSGSNRRRHRTSNSFRDSPDEDGERGLPGAQRLRDKVKKDRDRERDLRERSDRSSKRRRAERLMKNRDEVVGDGTSDENASDEEEEDEETAAVRVTAPSLGNNHHGGALTNHHHSHSSNFGQQVQNSNSTRKAYIPGSSASKNFRAPPLLKPADEMIGVRVPRKARTASAKMSHDWISSSSNNNSSGAFSGGEQTPLQESSSPARHALAPASTPLSAAPVSPSSSNASVGKKHKTSVKSAGGPKMKPPKSSQKTSEPPEALEIEIAEVLYGMMTESQGRSSIKKEDPRKANGSDIDAKLRTSSPVSNCLSPLSVSAPKRKRPRKVPDISSYGELTTKLKANPPPPLKVEGSSPVEKLAGQNGYVSGASLVGSHGEQAETAAVAKPPESTRLDSDSKETRDFAVKGEKEPLSAREDEIKDFPPPTAGAFSVAADAKSNVVAHENQTPKDPKLEIDLMAAPPQPEGESPDAAKEGFNDKLLKVEKLERDFDLNAVRSKTQQQIQPKASKEESVGPPASAGALPLPLSMTSWPPMGYMAPLQGMVPMDGNSASNNVQPSFSLPRPKRCATHFHIAKNILILQRFIKMGPPWAGSSGSASLSVSKSSNLNAGIPAADPQEKSSQRALYASVDKEQSGGGKEKATQQMSSDSKKQHQVLIQPPGNLLGPAFIFPLNQQQQQQPGAIGACPKSTGVEARTNISSSTSASNGSSSVSFNYPPNESQYLAILPNNGYPFPVAGVGAPPPAMSLFNGSFFSPQMIHPSQIPAAQMAQWLQAQTSAPNSSQKALLQQSLLHNVGPGNMNLQNFSSHQSKSQPAKTIGGDSASTKDGIGARVAMNVYNQFYPQNFTLMAPASANAAISAEKKVYQQQGAKPEPLPPSFAMSFGSINGAIPHQAIDIASATQQNIIMAAATAAHKSSFRVSEDAKFSGVDSSTSGEDKKMVAGKTISVGQSIGIPRSEMADSPAVPPFQANMVMDSSGRAVVRSGTSLGGNSGISNANIQVQMQQEQQRLSSTPAKRSKYSEHLASAPTMVAKFPSSLSGFPHNLFQSNTSIPNQSKITTSQASSSSTLQNHASQTSMHTRISFGGDQKKSLSSQGQAPPSNSQHTSPRIVGSPTSSVSKSASVLGKIGQPSSLSVQSPKSSGSNSIPSQKSTSVLGNPNTGSSGEKIEVSNAMHQSHLFFSNPCVQSSTSTSGGGYFLTKRRPEHQQMPHSSTSGMPCSIPPVSMPGTATNGQFTVQTPGGVLPVGFPYHHPVPAAVQAKPAEQKLPAA